MNPAVRPRRKAKSVHAANPAILEDLDAEDFPDQLQGLADDVITFLDCLNEFPEFTDEGVNTSITSLEGDLKVRAGRALALPGVVSFDLGAAVQMFARGPGVTGEPDGFVLQVCGEQPGPVATCDGCIEN